jgi:hypothetical protein
VQALAGEKRAWESERDTVTGRGSYTARPALAGKKSGESFSRVFEKTRRGF